MIDAIPPSNKSSAALRLAELQDKLAADQRRLERHVEQPATTYTIASDEADVALSKANISAKSAIVSHERIAAESAADTARSSPQASTVQSSAVQPSAKDASAVQARAAHSIDLEL